MAAAYFKYCIDKAGLKEIESDSAGIRANIREHVAQETIDALAKIGLAPLRIGTQLLTPKLIKIADLIVCMTSSQKDEVESSFVAATRKTVTLMSIIKSPKEVFDPHKQGLEKYVQCLDMMKPALEELAEKLG